MSSSNTLLSSATVTARRAVRSRKLSLVVAILSATLIGKEPSSWSRAQDSPTVVAARMATSAEEMSHWSEYDFVIINNDIDESVAQARAILIAERLRRSRQTGLADLVGGLRAG